MANAWLTLTWTLWLTVRGEVDHADAGHAQAVKTLVQAFIRMDYCNSLFYGITEGLMSRLQFVQNAAARLVSGARRYDHITPVLQELHWLQFDVGWISRWPPWSTCHCPVWLQPIWPPNVILVSDKGRRQLRSATSRTCVVRRTYSNYGDGCFYSCRSEAVEQPSSWTATSWH